MDMNIRNPILIYKQKNLSKLNKIFCQGALILPVLVLNSCAYFPPAVPQGKEEWQKGWSDGCNFVRAFSGYGNAWEIDVSRRYSDLDYDQGVRDGISACEQN
jgi:hypothetical protein|tara:strand:- start:838 stop:1143 length:306 start_codon:yes stop_codon:yes gene_type:complete